MSINSLRGAQVTDQVDHFQMARCIAALRIEVSTGMSHSRGSMLKYVQRTYGVTAKTKKSALEVMEALYFQRYGRHYGEVS
jgi:hypothetical protein